MGLLGKIFGGGKKAESTPETTVTVECPHAVLVPRWDSVQDMGIEDKATRFMCESCKQFFTPEEATRLKETLGERVAATMEEITEASESHEQSSH